MRSLALLPARIRLWAALPALLLLVSPAPAASVRVVATTTIVADLVREVGGDRVRVEALMGPGVDPHLYRASARDVSRLARAQAIFYSGLLLEGRMQDVLQQMKRRGRKVYAVAEAVPEPERITPPQFAGHPDPHVWGDPALWKHAAHAVAAALGELDEAGADVYRRRASEYVGKLESLREWARQQIESIPETRRVLITSHDAFNYFGRAFGLEVVGVQGISTESAAGLADITRIVDLVKERGIRAVFVETSVSPATVERISRDSGARIGGELFSDALGAPGEMRECGDGPCDVGTYLGMLKYNVHTVAEALR